MAPVPCLYFLTKFNLKKMDFEFMNYSGENDAERITAAPARRQKGAVLLQQIKGIKQEWHRIFEHAKAQGIKPAQILEKYIRKNPAAIDSAKDYIRSRGIVPLEELHEISLQYARLRDQQINDVVDMYDVENYENFEEDADNLFGRTGKKYRAKHDGMSRKEVRERRRSDRKGNRTEPGEEALETAPDPENIFEEGAAPAPADVANSPLPLPAFSTNLPPVELQTPSAEEAEAEILGEESDYEGYEGEHEETLPAINAIGLLGRINYDLIESDNATGPNDTSKVEWGKLFQSITSAAGETASTVKALKKNKKNLNAGDIYKDVKTHVTATEKNNYLKENAATIVVGVIVIAAIGYIIAKS